MDTPFDTPPPPYGTMSGDWSDSDATPPGERYPNYDQRQRKGGSVSEQRVWDEIAKRYPRKFKRALAYSLWLDRMYKRFSDKVV